MRVLERAWEGRDPGSALLRVVLAPASWPYAAAVALRAELYDRGWLSSRHAPAAVLSVGNLRVGGTGKTPFVIWLVARLRELGCRPVVISRGYGRDRDKPCVVLAGADSPSSPRPRGDGRFDAVDVGEALSGEQGCRTADEPVLIAARALCPVVVWPDRVAGAEIACRDLGADVVVMDDGFQHRRLHRDLDIVLLADGDEGARLLPAGPLRESPRALTRAGVVVHAAGSAQAPRARTVVEGFVDDVRACAPSMDAEALGGREVLAVAGIARPGRLVDSLEAVGATVRDLLVFADHHDYDERDWRVVNARARGCDYVVTTEKDLVKLAGLAGGAGAARRDDSSPPLVAARVSIEVEEEARLMTVVAAALEAGRLRLDRDAEAPHDRELGART